MRENESADSNDSGEQSNPQRPEAFHRKEATGERSMLPDSAPMVGGIREDCRQHAKANFFGITFYQILLRIGWIFKTESVIMPAFLDLIGGSGWLRGFLPMLNRFGQSIPPLLISERVRNRTQKKYFLACTTIVMGLCFVFLSLLWNFTEGKFVAMPLVFLVVYGIFFVATGINQLIVNTLIGKLVVVNARGRLAAASSLVGGIGAVLSAWFLLRNWLSDESGRFELIFGFTGVAFLLAGMVCFFLIEPKDESRTDLQSSSRLLKSSLKTVVADKNFRVLMIVAAMFGMSMVLTPHYQTLARERLSVGFTSLIPWVIAQHIGASLLSIPAGWIADRWGNRIVLKWLMFMLCLTPVLGLGLTQLGSIGRQLYPFVFFLLGLVPITLRFLNNYTLEVTDSENHPKYLSTLGLFLSVPVMLTAILFGSMIDWFGFGFVFLAVWCCMLFGWAMTFRLEEPRNGSA
jgi:MFS family permease